MTQTLIHLVRHAEVENPNNIWYGRLEGWVLSERGLRQIAALAEHFAETPLAAVYTSPLTRAIQTSTAIATPHGIQVKVMEDIIESEAHLQGLPGDRRLFRNPGNVRYFVNPMKPSWGEPYVSVRARMAKAVAEMRREHAGGEVVAVSHQTPVLVARPMFEKNPKPPWRAKVPCQRASITTLKFEDEEFVGIEYLPVGSSIT
ncbi:MAG TPA: histidine phosphatase family protein [Actinomycetota bacterium]|nr:histidine phosphatase family protein [Actinomycetota bacterium]